MAGTPNQKQKTLYLLRILSERTDAEHAMTVAEMTEALAKLGIESERKSIYRDLRALSDAGFSVGTIRSKDTRYYWQDRALSRDDCMALMNLLHVCAALPRKRKLELEKKIRAMLPLPQQRASRQPLLTVVSEGAVTERIYSNVELLYQAIRSGVRVRFTYKSSSLQEIFPRRQRTPRLQTVSPYRVVWSDGYYLIGADSDDDLVFYRVARMEGITLTNLQSADIRTVGGDLDFDLEQYIKGSFSALADLDHMIFRVSEGFLNVAERRFPTDSQVEPAEEGWCLLTCDAPADENLFGWLLQHSSEIRLIYPESLVLRLQSLSRRSSLDYGINDAAECGINFEENGKTVDKPYKMRYN